jgi:thiamine biosynthesis lipoprotein
MGVDTRIVVYAKDKKTAEDACAAAFERISVLDTAMSDYMKSSELTRLSDGAGGPAVKVSEDLFRVLKMSQEVSSLSDGYFDVTVGPLVQLWRKARKTVVLPVAAEIERARGLVGWQMVKLDDMARTVQLVKPGMRLDLGAIGKGFADDEAQIVLKKYGIKSALVEMGGDIVVSDSPPGKPGWVIQVSDGKTETKKMTLSNCAISTSGDAEQFVIIGGVRYSHVVDPHTGYALTKGVQATITAKTGLIADPVSTALTLLDEAGRKRLLRHYPGTKVYLASRTIRP